MIGRRTVRAAAPEPAPSASVAIEVQVIDEQTDVVLDGDGDRYGRLAALALGAEGITGPAELTLTFVDEAAMAELNAEHLNEDGSTDVLSFPLWDPDEVLPTGMVALLGDVVICPAVADARYAAEHGRTLEEELALLVVHGVLHVLGHDHAEDDEAAVIRDHELRHLRAFIDPTFTL